MMHEEGGKPTGKEYRLSPSDDPHMVASRLARKAWLKGKDEGDFNRPLRYNRLGIA
jgi:hypothetical protein